MKNNEKKIIVVIDGPSGVGKDTLFAKLIEKCPHLFKKAQSTTTRPMRFNESQGNPYFFVSKEEFERGIENGDFFEHTTRHGTYRGMSKHLFDAILEEGKIPIKDCDYIGLNALREIYPGQVIGIFVNAPKEVVVERLVGRDRNDKTLSARIADYDTYVKTREHFDHEVQNLDVEDATKEIIGLIEKFYENKKEK